MVKNIYYVNSKGQRIDFDSQTYYFAGIGSMLKYDWEYAVNDYKDVIDAFQTSLVKKEFTVAVKGNTQEDYHNLIEYIENVFDYDLANKSQGKMFFGEWYLPCYIIGCSDDTYSPRKKMGARSYKIVSEDGQWVRATRYRNYDTLNRLSYPLDFTIDHKSIEPTHLAIINKTVRDCDFKMVITNPGNLLPDYLEIEVVNLEDEKTSTRGITRCDITKDNGYIVVDSRDLTITYYTEDGDAVNYFQYRDKTLDDIFEKINQGVNRLTAKGIDDEEEYLIPMGIEMVVYETKSNPEWWT